MKGMGRVRGPCCICSGDMMNFMEPANRKRRAARIWAVQRTRLVVLAVEVDMIGSPVAFRRVEGPGLGPSSASHHHVERPDQKSTFPHQPSAWPVQAGLALRYPRKAARDGSTGAAEKLEQTTECIED